MTWCPFAKVVIGGPGKWNQGALHATGAVLHSAEGYLGHILAEVQGPVQLSWHFTVGYDGALFEHYPIETKCWHAHAAGNEHYLGIEHEGVAGEPETDAQVATDIRLLAWLGQTLGWPGFERGVQLWEHHEVPGNATACPSDRIRWGSILDGLQPAPAPVIDGIGVVLDDGTDIGNILPALPDGRTVAGVGAHLTDGRIEGLWPK